MKTERLNRLAARHEAAGFETQKYVKALEAEVARLRSGIMRTIEHDWPEVKGDYQYWLWRVLESKEDESC